MTDRCQYCKTPLGSYGATPCCAWAEIDSLKARLAEMDTRCMDFMQLNEQQAIRFAACEANYEQLQARCFDRGGSQSVFDRCAELERDNVALAEFALRLLR